MGKVDEHIEVVREVLYMGRIGSMSGFVENLERRRFGCMGSWLWCVLRVWEHLSDEGAG
jgi:hypothetical protein